MNQLANLLGGKVDNENRESELTIKAVSNVIPKWARRNIDHCSIYLIVNVETFEEMYQKFEDPWNQKACIILNLEIQMQ